MISQSYSVNRPVIHNPDTAVKIQVHPGDFEWLREVCLWVEWIEKNLGVDKNNFDVYSNKLLKADEAWVSFKDPTHLLLFGLKAPRDIWSVQ